MATAVEGEKTMQASNTPGVGHNRGPALDAGHAWRRHAWTRARASLAPRAGLEVVRRHVARAAALGLPYPLYASIRLGTGRDVAALMLSGAALGYRRRGALAAPVVATKLAAVEAERLLLTQAVQEVVAPAQMGGVGFEAAGPAPSLEASWSARRRAVLALTRARKLPTDAVVLIGGRPAERGWAEAGWLARYIEAETYFGEEPRWA